MQHFDDGDFVERVQTITEMEGARELESIMSIGQRPRLFMVQRSGNSLSVKELLAAADFQAITEQSTTRISKKDDCVVTLWFDTEPKSFREIRITTKLSDEIKTQVTEGMAQQREAETQRMKILDSVGDPKWRELEEKEKEQEGEIAELLKRYNAELLH
jgi:hypothetical protein